MKFYFCQNNLKFYFSLLHVNSLKKRTGNQIENISFRPKWQKQSPEVFCKKDVKIWQNSQKNNNAGFLFNKIAVLYHVTLLKRDPNVRDSLEILWNI